MVSYTDSCHSLICALLLLNTDLHAEVCVCVRVCVRACVDVISCATFQQHTGSRMTQAQFITNLQGTGESYPKEMLKVGYIQRDRYHNYPHAGIV